MIYIKKIKIQPTGLFHEGVRRNIYEEEVFKTWSLVGMVIFLAMSRQKSLINFGFAGEGEMGEGPVVVVWPPLIQVGRTWISIHPTRRHEALDDQRSLRHRKSIHYVDPTEGASTLPGLTPCSFPLRGGSGCGDLHLLSHTFKWHSRSLATFPSSPFALHFPSLPYILWGGGVASSRGRNLSDEPHCTLLSPACWIVGFYLPPASLCLLAGFHLPFIETLCTFGPWCILM